AAGEVQVTVFVPAAFWSLPTAQEQVITAFFGALPTKNTDAAAVVFNTPPTNQELDEAADTDAQYDRLAQSAEQQLFGANGTLTLLSVRGDLPPISTIVPRAKRGA
ncbi:MAG: hypothetical protein AAGP08_16605, partial [Pseudomonadota bacterium]